MSGLVQDSSRTESWRTWLLLGNVFCMFAYCGLVVEILKFLLPFQRQPREDQYTNVPLANPQGLGPVSFLCLGSHLAHAH